jgi:outer membrane protein assembly factor BamD
VVNRYSNSQYAADSAQRMIWLRNLLARHEYGTALYYYRKGAYVSSANRAQFLIETYPQSEFQNDSVALMAANYKALGQSSLEQDARKVLAANEPNHPYLNGERWPPKRRVWRQLNPFAGELQK